jgi:hypothetical protein
VDIPASQLETWANRSQTDTAVNAHTRIRDSLRASASPIRIIDFSDYLQGSYRNSTNIWRDSDVDIVVQLNTAFFYTFDTTMPSSDQTACQSAITPATFHLEHFRPNVIGRLVDVYGWQNVEEGNKAVLVKGAPGARLDADVVICQQHRLYYDFNGDPHRGFHQGIGFRDRRDNRLIVNFPQQHLDNGEQKNLATNGGFKKTVRIYKNARNYLVDNGRLPEGSAPSYFLQGLLYNVPSQHFRGDTVVDFLSSIDWFGEHVEQFETFYCQTGLIRLFGNTPEQW